MTKAGEPAVLADFRPRSQNTRPPGPWLVTRAIQLACARARNHGTGTVVIRRSHHLACLAAYLRPVSEQGLMILLSSSDPAAGGVAPHGGRRSATAPTLSRPRGRPATPRSSWTFPPPSPPTA